MHPHIVSRLRKSAGPFALSNLALALIVAIAYGFDLNIAIVALLCLLVIVLHALADGFVSSAIVSIIAGSYLVYLFSYRIFEFRIDDPADLVVFLVFLIVSNVLAWIASKGHATIGNVRRQLSLAESIGHIAVWDRDLRTNIIEFAGDYSKIYGLAAGQRSLTYGEWLRLIHPEDRERVLAAVQETLTRTHIWDEEFRIVWPDGSIRWLLGKGTGFSDEIGRPVRIAGVNIDITERKRAEDALRESEERLRFAQQVASIGTFDWNIETGVNTCTPELEAIYGFPRGGFPGTQSAWDELVHPDDRPLALERVMESFETGTPAEAEWRIILRDGGVRWIFGRWQVFKNAAGEPQRMRGVNMDVTDRKYVEEALRRSEERFRLAVQATNDAVWDIDLATGTVSWNETYATLYGRPPETSKSWQWWIDRIHAEDRERTSEGLASAISGSESTWTCEYRFQRVDGTWAYIYDRAYIARDPSGVAWRVIGAMQDLTQRKRVEAELRESEERFRNIADSAPVVVWVSGLDGVATFVNRYGLNFYGRTLEQMVGTAWPDLVHPDDSERVAAEFSAAVADCRTYQISFRVRRADGEYRWVLSNGCPRFAGEVYTGHIGITTDITEVKQSQEQLQAAQKLESLGVLAGGIAHDFNNLLGGIHSVAELVEMDLAPGSPCREEIQRIKTATIRGSEIVRELMIYAGEGQKDIKEAVDVARLVEEMFELLKVSISKQVALRTDFRGDLPTVWGNASQIRQVVMNLILNASEAIGDTKGAITLTTEHLSGGRDLAPNNAIDLTPGDYVRIEVSDTGSGMTEEIKAKIFDPFFSTKFAGRGLGLAVVQGIVRDLGGAINMVSAPGEGTAFQVLLPRAPERAYESDSTSAFGGMEKSNAQARTILVVEDEETLRRAVSIGLRKLGFSAIEASDGSVALDLLRAHKNEIDVLLLDVTLPGASSREVFEEALRIRPNLKVIITSAYDEEMVDAYYSGLRVTHFIRKPFRLDDLVRLFEVALSARAH